MSDVQNFATDYNRADERKIGCGEFRFILEATNHKKPSNHVTYNDQCEGSRQ